MMGGRMKPTTDADDQPDDRVRAEQDEAESPASDDGDDAEDEPLARSPRQVGAVDAAAIVCVVDSRPAMTLSPMWTSCSLNRGGSWPVAGLAGSAAPKPYCSIAWTPLLAPRTEDGP